MGPFIYSCDRSVEANRKSQEYIETVGYEDKISELAWVCRSIGDLIPHTSENLFSGHFFPWTEAWDELQVSFNLCLFGFYKQAMVSLRSGLELGLLSAYWNLNDDGHKTIKAWINSKENTPRLSEIWKKIGKHQNFNALQQNYDIKTRLLALRYLHNYVHTKGYNYSNKIGLLKSNFQTFEAKGFDNWYDTFKEIVEVLSILHLVKYPIGTVKYDYSKKFGIDVPWFGGISSYEVERIEKIIGKDIFKYIEAIAKTDQTVQDIMRWMSSLPDMTKEQAEQQIIDSNKRDIEMGGLEVWLKNQKVLSKHWDKDAVYRQRIEYLTHWAKENGYEKSVIERQK